MKGDVKGGGVWSRAVPCRKPFCGGVLKVSASGRYRGHQVVETRLFKWMLHSVLNIIGFVLFPGNIEFRTSGKDIVESH
jgi:hypothetical protein